MRTNYLFYLFVIFSTCLLYSQDSIDNTISSSGKPLNDGNTHLEIVVGEPISDFLISNSNQLSLGFHNVLSLELLSSNEEELFDVKLWPNPASTEVHLKSKAETIDYQFYDLFGKKINVSGSVDANDQIEINISRLPVATYLVYLKSENEKVKVYKLIITK